MSESAGIVAQVRTDIGLARTALTLCADGAQSLMAHRPGRRGRDC